MPVLAKNEGKSYEISPIGVVQAVCAFVEDIGTHQSDFQGKPVQRHQIVVCWELNEHMKLGDNAGKPFMMSKFYTLSLNEKANLRKDLESWRGKAFTEEELKGFDVEKLIGVNCLLNIVSSKRADGTDTAKIAAIMPLTKGMPTISRIANKAPDWIAEFRAKSIEAQNSSSAATARTEPQQDDLPF